MGKTQNDIQPLVEKFQIYSKVNGDHYLCVKRIGETLACGKNDEFHEWMKLVEALLGASKPSRNCSALTWAILCRVQFASLFDMWPLWFGQKLIMQPMQYSKLRSMARCLITEQSNVCIYFQVSKLLRSWASHQCIIKNTQAERKKHFCSSDAGILSAHPGSWAGGLFICIVTSLIKDQNNSEFD